MSPLLYLILGFAPGVFWLWQIARRSQHRPEPRSLVLRTFLLGVAVAVPIVAVESIVQGPNGVFHNPDGTMPPETAFFVAFAVAGLVEEIGKFWVVRATLFRSPYFDDPLRGLVYSAAVALGFSSIENVKYMVDISPMVIVPRSVLCTLGHVAFSGCWGYALGAARQRGDQRPLSVALGLIAGVALHGLYDYFLMTGDHFSGLLVFVLSAVIFFVLLARARRQSQARHPEVTAVSICPVCRTETSLPARHCIGCGRRVERSQTEQRCGQCQQPLLPGSRFCTSCGGSIGSEATA